MIEDNNSNQPSFADRVLDFLKSLNVQLNLPDGIEVLNPYKPGTETWNITEQFYRKFYSGERKRSLILGINPGRLGAGATGIPFTDTKRLLSHCDISCSFSLHEPSSVFVHQVIDAFGGPRLFYERFFISSVSPLGFVKINERGKPVNYNYYDSKALEEAVRPFILQSLQKVIDMGVKTDRVYCMGTGKNFKYLEAFNNQHKLFGDIIPLEHPRYVMQYKSKHLNFYVEKYLEAFAG